MNGSRRTLRPTRWVRALLSLALVGTSPLFGQGADCKPFLIQKPQMLEWKLLDGNQINCTIASDGPYADPYKTNRAGLEWPKGSGKTAVYTAGIWIVGKHVPSQSLRTAVMDYNSEYQPGPLLEIFNTSTNDDAGPVSRMHDSRYRLYKIDRGDTLSTDYVEWPGDLGAPYVDMNANGSWDQGIDKPRIYGDQQIWGVINDVDNARHAALGATPPMGLEIRVLYWAFNRPGPPENTMFIRWEIINRADADYDSVYLALWDDVDLGYSSDDLPGCDTTLHMGYVYNGDDDDEGSQGYGSTPPAIGIVYLQGPIVHGMPGDIARFMGGQKEGFKNIGMTSFLSMACGTFPDLGCGPPDGDPAYAPIAYNYLRGMLGSGAYLTRPDSSIMKFFFSGDPLTGTGDLPATFPLGPWNPQEAYVLTNTGPFSLAQGDTQEVVAAVVLSQGTDRLQSVKSLKQDVTLVREMFQYGRPSASAVQVEKNQSMGNTVPLVGNAVAIFSGTIASTTWVLTERPAGSSAVVADPLSPSTTITPDVVGFYRVLFVAENNAGVRDTAEVSFTAVSNRPPVVEFSIPSTVVLGDSIRLDGSGTTDPDNDALVDEWEVGGVEYYSLMPPAYRTAADSAMCAIVDTGTVRPRLYPYRTGLLAVTYRVTDGFFPREITKSVNVVPKATPQFAFLSEYDMSALPTLGFYGFGAMQVFAGDLWCWVGGAYFTPNFAWNSDPAQSYAMMYGLHYVDGNRIFNARGTGGLDIYETDQYRSFTAVRESWRPFGASGMPVPQVVQAYHRDPTLFMTCGTGGVVAYENYSSGAGTRVGAYRDGTSWGKFVVDGTNLYALIAGSDTVKVLDIAVPGGITLAGSFAVPGPFARIRKSGDLLFLQNDTTLVMFDVSSLSAPVLLGTLDVPRTHLPVNIYWNFWVHGKYLVLGTQEGIYEYDVANPAAPQFLESYISGHPNTNVYLDDSRLLSTQWDWWGSGAPGRLEGLLMFDTGITGIAREERGAPSAFALDQNYPNPFNPSTTIRYALPARSQVTLTVFNMLGQRVAILVQGEQESGHHEIQFDASGLASGVYLYQLRVRGSDSSLPRGSGGGDDDFVQTRRLVILR